MAFLWGTVVLISVVLNSYLSLPPIINMILLDRSFDSIIQAINSGDVALIASLTNAVVASRPTDPPVVHLSHPHRREFTNEFGWCMWQTMQLLDGMAEVNLCSIG